MAHNTRIGGTAYEITGGRCLVGGTGYDISAGRTLIGGTGYDITFGSKYSYELLASGTFSSNGTTGSISISPNTVGVYAVSNSYRSSLWYVFVSAAWRLNGNVVTCFRQAGNNTTENYNGIKFTGFTSSTLSYTQVVKYNSNTPTYYIYGINVNGGYSTKSGTVSLTSAGNRYVDYAENAIALFENTNGSSFSGEIMGISFMDHMGNGSRTGFQQASKWSPDSSTAIPNTMFWTYGTTCLIRPDLSQFYFENTSGSATYAYQYIYV